MKKKVLAVLLAATMGLGLMAGCGSQTTKTYSPELPTEEESADIYVEKIDGLSSDFIKGMDVSSVLAEEASGVKYYDAEGNETDLFQILADNGINYIRVRVWNDPFDEDGNGYGGGNCDVKSAAEIGKRAAAYGMKLCVDFHYSDFWADPNKQYAPKAWEDMSLEEKEEALTSFTEESLKTISDAGAEIGMVQIGNEINNGMAGETDFDNKVELLKSASAAVRDFDEQIKVVVHFTQVDDTEGTLEIAQKLDAAELDYDVFGISYYSYWHGTMENMQDVLTQIKDKYGVETCVMETGYMYTGEDTDGFGNNCSDADMVEGYPVSVQGQANCVRDVMASASDAGALGVFYWEGAWIAVGDDYDSNQEIWEKNGSGWASSYSASYDAKDAGKYYGGCSWDNQAFFDQDGKVLPSLGVFKYVNYGAVGQGLEVLGVNPIAMEIGVGEDLELPSQVDAIYNDSSCTDPVAVTWDSDQLAAVDTSVAGTYTVEGQTEDGTAVTASIKVASQNFVQNSSFEDADTSMWTVVTDGTDPTDVQNKSADAVTGDNAFHWWNSDAMDFEVEQTMTGLAAGTYAATAQIQGGDVGDDAEIYLYVKVGDQIYTSDPVTLAGWVVWQTPTIEGIELTEESDVTIGMHITCAGGGWGTMDDFEFYNK